MNTYLDFSGLSLMDGDAQNRVNCITDITIPPTHEYLKSGVGSGQRSIH